MLKTKRTKTGYHGCRRAADAVTFPFRPTRRHFRLPTVAPAVAADGIHTTLNQTEGAQKRTKTCRA